jgi:hypothetical protein
MLQKLPEVEQQLQGHGRERGQLLQIQTYQ